MGIHKPPIQCVNIQQETHLVVVGSQHNPTTESETDENEHGAKHEPQQTRSTHTQCDQQYLKQIRKISNNCMWVRGLMAINVKCEFRDRGSIPSVCDQQYLKQIKMILKVIVVSHLSSDQKPILVSLDQRSMFLNFYRYYISNF